MKNTKTRQAELLKNPNVEAVTSFCIHYTNEFKQKALCEYTLGKTADQIFQDAGFNLQEISNDPDYASKTHSKWQCKNKNKNIQYPKKKRKGNLNTYQKLLARNEYPEAENEFLKKLHALIQEQS